MLGYKYEDIQKMGGAINTSLRYFKDGSEVQKGLLMVHDLLDGLLAEGYVSDEVKPNV
jgi:hypothetical protein